MYIYMMPKFEQTLFELLKNHSRLHRRLFETQFQICLTEQNLIESCTSKQTISQLSCFQMRVVLLPENRRFIILTLISQGIYANTNFPKNEYVTRTRKLLC